MKKIDFICSNVSIIVCLYRECSGIYSCAYYNQYTRKVFEEIKRQLKLENLVIEEIEDAFSIIVPSF